MEIKNQLQSQADKKCRVDFNELKLDKTFLRKDEVWINYPVLNASMPYTLRAVLGGTQGLRLRVGSINVEDKVQSDRQVAYSMMVEIEISDVFGANHNHDKWLPGVRAMWQLHHRSKKAVPFKQTVQIKKKLTGKILVPEEYSSITNEVK